MGVPNFYRPANATILLTLLCGVLGFILLISNNNDNNNHYHLKRRQLSHSVIRYDSNPNNPATGEGGGLDPSTSTTTTPISYFIQQRNVLSRLLNEEKKALGQQSCEMKKLTPHAQSVSKNGGWCADRSGYNSTEHKIDPVFAKTLSSFFTGKHVGSFGDGPGKYKEAVSSHGQVASYTAYDGAPFCEETTGGKVHFLDLTGPQFGLPAFDWVMSVEVGEHIPQIYENVYLDNIVRHAKEGVVLSWATPGQGGFSHVNNQPLSHVIEQMSKRGFNHVSGESDRLRFGAEVYWLRKNIHVYRRSDPSSFQPLDV